MKKFFGFVIDGYVRLLFPLLICIILIEKLLRILSPAINQLKEKIRISHDIEILPIFLISCFFLMILGLLAGLLLKSRFVDNKIKVVESNMLRKIPLYTELKSLLGKGNRQFETESFRPALIKDGEFFSLGYVTDESENFYAVVICDTELHGGELRVVAKSSVKLLDISFFDFARRIRMYGAKAADFAEETHLNPTSKEIKEAQNRKE